MEAIVCQSCEQVIAYVESEKVGTLYGQCPGCASGNVKEATSTHR